MVRREDRSDGVAAPADPLPPAGHAAEAPCAVSADRVSAARVAAAATR